MGVRSVSTDTSSLRGNQGAVTLEDGVLGNSLTVADADGLIRASALGSEEADGLNRATLEVADDSDRAPKTVGVDGLNRASTLKLHSKTVGVDGLNRASTLNMNSNPVGVDGLNRASTNINSVDGLDRATLEVADDRCDRASSQRGSDLGSQSYTFMKAAEETSKLSAGGCPVVNSNLIDLNSSSLLSEGNACLLNTPVPFQSSVPLSPLEQASLSAVHQHACHGEGANALSQMRYALEIHKHALYWIDHLELLPATNVLYWRHHEGSVCYVFGMALKALDFHLQISSSASFEVAFDRGVCELIVRYSTHTSTPDPLRFHLHQGLVSQEVWFALCLSSSNATASLMDMPEGGYPQEVPSTLRAEALDFIPETRRSKRKRPPRLGPNDRRALRANHSHSCSSAPERGNGEPTWGVQISPENWEVELSPKPVSDNADSSSGDDSDTDGCSTAVSREVATWLEELLSSLALRLELESCSPESSVFSCVELESCPVPSVTSSETCTKGLKLLWKKFPRTGRLRTYESSYPSEVASGMCGEDSSQADRSVKTARESSPCESTMPEAVATSAEVPPSANFYEHTGTRDVLSSSLKDTQESYVTQKNTRVGRDACSKELVIKESPCEPAPAEMVGATVETTNLTSPVVEKGSSPVPLAPPERIDVSKALAFWGRDREKWRGIASSLDRKMRSVHYGVGRMQRRQVLPHSVGRPPLRALRNVTAGPVLPLGLALSQPKPSFLPTALIQRAGFKISGPCERGSKSVSGVQNQCAGFKTTERGSEPQRESSMARKHWDEARKTPLFEEEEFSREMPSLAQGVSSTELKAPLCYVYLSLSVDGGTVSLVGGSTKKRKEQHVAPWEVEHTRVHASLCVSSVAQSDGSDLLITTPDASPLGGLVEDQTGGATNTFSTLATDGGSIAAVANSQLHATDRDYTKERSEGSLSQVTSHGVSVLKEGDSFIESEGATNGEFTLDNTDDDGSIPTEEALDFMIDKLLPSLNLGKSKRDEHDLAFMYWLRDVLLDEDEDRSISMLLDGHATIEQALHNHRKRLDNFLPSLVDGETLGYMELFAGCGGRAVGYDISNERAQHTDLRRWRGIAYETNAGAVKVFNRNVTSATCVERKIGDDADERYALPSSLPSRIVVLSAGPPCQPFANLGKGGGSSDSRDGFPALLKIIQDVQPLFVEIENVMGLEKHPDVLRTIFWELDKLGYAAQMKEVDASQYEVPQKRRRLLILASKWGVPNPPLPSPTLARTMEEALSPLGAFNPGSHPELELSEAELERHAEYERRNGTITPRRLERQQPARTVTGGNLRKSGKDALRLTRDDGMQRALTVEEGAALQSFPSNFSFEGVAHSSGCLMVGNAHPPMLGFYMSGMWRRLHALAACLFARCHKLLSTHMPSSAQYIPVEFHACLSRAIMEARHLCPKEVPCFAISHVFMVATRDDVDVPPTIDVAAVNPYGGHPLSYDSIGGRLLTRSLTNEETPQKRFSASQEVEAFQLLQVHDSRVNPHDRRALGAPSLAESERRRAFKRSDELGVAHTRVLSTQHPKLHSWVKCKEQGTVRRMAVPFSTSEHSMGSKNEEDRTLPPPKEKELIENESLNVEIALEASRKESLERAEVIAREDQAVQDAISASLQEERLQQSLKKIDEINLRNEMEDRAKAERLANKRRSKALKAEHKLLRKQCMTPSQTLDTSESISDVGESKSALDGIAPDATSPSYSDSCSISSTVKGGDPESTCLLQHSLTPVRGHKEGELGVEWNERTGFAAVPGSNAHDVTDTQTNMTKMSPSRTINYARVVANDETSLVPTDAQGSCSSQKTIETEGSEHIKCAISPSVNEGTPKAHSYADADTEATSETEMAHTPCSQSEYAMKEVEKILSSSFIANIGCYEEHVDHEIRSKQPPTRGRPDYFDFHSDTAVDATTSVDAPAHGVGVTAFMALSMVALTTPCGDDRTPMREVSRRQLVAHLQGLELPNSYDEMRMYGSINAMPAAAGDAESGDEESGYVHGKLHKSSGLGHISNSSPILLQDVAFRRSGGELGQKHKCKRVRNTLYDTGAALNVVDEKTATGWEKEQCPIHWHEPQALSLLKLGVVGGGSVMAVGACTTELLFRDEDTGEWHALEATFVVIRSKVRTCILGTPFHRDHNTVPFVDENRVLFRLESEDGEPLSFYVACEPVIQGVDANALLAYIEGAVQPIAYTSSKRISTYVI